MAGLRRYPNISINASPLGMRASLLASKFPDDNTEEIYKDIMWPPEAVEVLATAGAQTQGSDDHTVYGGVSRPAYEASSSASFASATSVNISVPTGTSAGDLLVVALYQNNDDRTVNSVPAGWTNDPVGNVDSGGSPADIRATYYWKFYDRNDPTSYTFGFSGSTSGLAQMVRVSGVDRTDSFGPIESGTFTAATTFTLEDLTPGTEYNVHNFYLGMVGADHTASVGTYFTTTDPLITKSAEAVDTGTFIYGGVFTADLEESGGVLTGHNVTTAASQRIVYAEFFIRGKDAPQVEGAAGGQTSDATSHNIPAAVGPDRVDTIYQVTTNNNLTVTLPAGVTTGDLMVIALYIPNVTSTVTAEPTGWTKLSGSMVTAGSGGGDDLQANLWYKVHDGSESDPAWTFGGSPPAVIAAGAVYRNVSASFFGSTAQTSTSTANQAITGFDTEDDSALVFAIGGVDHNANVADMWTPATSWTELREDRHTATDFYTMVAERRFGAREDPTSTQTFTTATNIRSILFHVVMTPERPINVIATAGGMTDDETSHAVSLGITITHVGGAQTNNGTTHEVTAGVTVTETVGALTLDATTHAVAFGITIAGVAAAQTNDTTAPAIGAGITVPVTVGDQTNAGTTSTITLGVTVDATDGEQTSGTTSHAIAFGMEVVGVAATQTNDTTSHAVALGITIAGAVGDMALGTTAPAIAYGVTVDATDGEQTNNTTTVEAGSDMVVQATTGDTTLNATTHAVAFGMTVAGVAAAQTNDTTTPLLGVGVTVVSTAGAETNNGATSEVTYGVTVGALVADMLLGLTTHTITTAPPVNVEAVVGTMQQASQSHLVSFGVTVGHVADVQTNAVTTHSVQFGTMVAATAGVANANATLHQILLGVTVAASAGGLSLTTTSVEIVISSGPAFVPQLGTISGPRRSGSIVGSLSVTGSVVRSGGKVPV